MEFVYHSIMMWSSTLIDRQTEGRMKSCVWWWKPKCMSPVHDLFVFLSMKPSAVVLVSIRRYIVTCTDKEGKHERNQAVAFNVDKRSALIGPPDRRGLVSTFISNYRACVLLCLRWKLYSLFSAFSNSKLKRIFLC